MAEENGLGGGTLSDKEDSSVNKVIASHKLEAISEINEFEEDSLRKKRQSQRNNQGLAISTAKY